MKNHLSDKCISEVILIGRPRYFDDALEASHQGSRLANFIEDNITLPIIFVVDNENLIQIKNKLYGWYKYSFVYQEAFVNPYKIFNSINFSFIERQALFVGDLEGQICNYEIERIDRKFQLKVNLWFFCPIEEDDQNLDKNYYPAYGYSFKRGSLE